jgi:transposase
MYGSRNTLQKESDVSPRKRRKFTAEQKAEAVKLVKEVGSISPVARDLDLHESVLGRWVKQAEVDCGQGPEGALTTEEKEELRKLRRENKRLRMERDFLKKAATFFAKDTGSIFELIETEKAHYPVSVMCSVSESHEAVCTPGGTGRVLRGMRSRMLDLSRGSGRSTRRVVAPTGVHACMPSSSSQARALAAIA